MEPKKINLGCGSTYINGWINVDFTDEGVVGKIKVDDIYNMLEGLPYEDSTIDEIQLLDVLEHFNRWNGLYLLQEIYRVLKPSGRFRITVPPAILNLKRLLFVMENVEEFDMHDFFDAHSVNPRYWKWHDDLTGATRRSDGMDGDSHKAFYTVGSLKSIMEFVGFKILSAEGRIIQIVATKDNVDLPKIKPVLTEI